MSLKKIGYLVEDLALHCNTEFAVYTCDALYTCGEFLDNESVV